VKFEAVYQRNEHCASIVIEVQCCMCKDWTRVLLRHNEPTRFICEHCRDIGREYKERKT
jgi:hypothetical protein